MERLQKVLARAGIASRRAAEQIILAGRVRVDGRIVRELGTQVDRRSRVEVDGTKIVAEKLVYIVLHKPRGVVCTMSDPEGRPTIRELIKEAGGRLVPVGRLDFHTSGALICTNDGEFAQGLAHPKREVPKVYVAKVKGTVDDEALEGLRKSIVLDGRPTEPAQVKLLRYEADKTWLEITLREGRNRQVRRLGEATGFPVMRLARISHAGVSSEDLRPGQWRPLSVDELTDLKKDYGVPKKVRAPEYDPVAAKKRERAPAWEPRTTRAHKSKAAPAHRKTPFEHEPTERVPRGQATSRNDARRDNPSFGERPQRGSFSSRQASPRGDRPQRANSSSRREPSQGDRAQSARASSRSVPSRNERAQSAHASSRSVPSRNERAQSAGIPSRTKPSQGDRAQSARHDDLNRPWKTRSRSATEARPGTNSARPSADRGSEKKSRRTR
jgi:23S rRNA pseudouridine2605 synthase